MNEPMDEELRDYVDAFRASERPTAAARESTWAQIEARVAAEPVARGVRRGVWVAVALAAMVILAIGLATGGAWRGRTTVPVEASHVDGGGAARGVVTGVEPQGMRSAVEGEGGSRGESEGPPVEMEGGENVEGRGEMEGGERVESRARSRGRRVEEDASLRPEEVRSFRRARAALARGDAAGALEAVEEHGRRFPGGFFAAELEVSRVQALCELGREPEGRAARDAFLLKNPGSHLGERMRGLCGEKE